MAGRGSPEREQAGTPFSAFYPMPVPGEGRRVRAPAPAEPAAEAQPALEPMSDEEREQTVDELMAVLEGLYAHLPLKRARYATDPLQRLRLLAQQSRDLDDLEFHHQLASIFVGLRDGHTRYIGPTALEGWAAHLGFLVEMWGGAAEPHYVVSKVTPGLIDDDRFTQGVELVWWNGVPIDTAVDLHADRETGGRPDTRRARALESLTLRALQFSPPPSEHWVDVGYVDADGETREVRVHWRIVEPGRARTAAVERTGAYAVDPAAESTRRVKKMLFAYDRWVADQEPAPPRAARAEHEPFQDQVTACEIPVGSHTYGVLRLWSFDLADDRHFVDEVVRLLGTLTDRGLIVDLRANPGGLVRAADRLLQLFTPNHIVPARFSMLATKLTREMASRGEEGGPLAPWARSLDAAVSTGELYSAALPLTSVDDCNDIGQVYGGPVVAVVDAKSYSAADLFAAGWVDNGVGPLVTVGQASGGGGAEVWTDQTVRAALLGTPFQQPGLPGGAGFTIAVRRALRTGDAVGAAGSAIEDVGITATAGVHEPTAGDLVDNRDLYDACGRILARTPRSSLRHTLDPATRRVTVKAEALDRLASTVDGRPFKTATLGGRPVHLTLPTGWQTAELLGYAGSSLCQRRLLRAD